MTRNQDIRVSDTLGWGEHGVQSPDCSPIGKEMTLIVMCPWVIAEIILVIDCRGECEFVGRGVGDDTCIGESGNGDLAFFQLSAEGAK